MDISEIVSRTKVYINNLPEGPLPMKPPSGREIASWIDHTLLKPEATAEQIKKICKEAVQYKFASVCVNPVFTPLVSGLLEGSSVGVCSVVGFPLGASPTTVKAFETLHAIQAGATEIDMVINIGALKGNALGQVANEVRTVTDIAHNQSVLVKVILEMALLSQEEKIIACLLCEQCDADYVKTSTGFGPGGATVEDVNLMYRLVGHKLKVKAAGGIRSFQDAFLMIQAGASRIGASAGVNIVNEAE